MQEQKKYTKLSLVWEFLKGSRGYFIISILATLAFNALEMISPQIIRTTVDSVIGDKALELPSLVMKIVRRIGGVEYLRSHLWVIGLVIAVLALACAGFRYIYMLYNSKGAERFVKTMRNQLFSHIQRLPFSWHMKNQTGDIIQRCTSDVDMIKNFISEQLTAVFSESLNGDDVGACAQADMLFHDAIYEATGNNRLIQILNNLREQMYRYRMEYLKDRHSHAQLLKEHEEILNALKCHDEKSALEWISRHIERQKEHIISILNQKEQGGQ